MYSQTDINEAVAGGALTEEQANSLRSFIAGRNGVPTADEEHFRFFKGYNDLMCFTACIFGLIAVAWLGSLIQVGSGRGRMAGGMPVSAPFAALFVAAASWGMAEIFTRKRHQWLTSILLVIGFTWGVAIFLASLLLSGGMGGPSSASVFLAISFAAGGGAAFLHWKRFRQPIAIATIYGFGMLAIMGLLANSMGRSGGDMVAVIALVAGVGAFLFAMWWDGKDPTRHNEKSEIGMWLHWLAAAVIVNALATLFGVSNGVGSVAGAIGVIVLYLLFALVGLTVNRRAFVLAGLSPLLLAMRSLVQGGGGGYRGYQRMEPNPYSGNPYGSSYGGSPYGNPYANPYSDYSTRSYPSVEGTMITIAIIGLILLLLAIYWAPLRRAIVGVLPEGMRAKLPPTGAEPTAQASTFE